MKIAKKLMAIGLAVVFLTACSSRNSNENYSRNEKEEDTISETRNPYYFIETPMNLVGRTFRILTVSPRNNWANGITDEAMCDETRKMMEILREIEYDYNVSIEINTHSAAGMMGMLTENRRAEARFDLFEVSIMDFRMTSLWEWGLAVPVTHLEVVDVIMPDCNPWRHSELTTFGEHQWAVGFRPFTATPVIQNVLMFNETMRGDFALPNFYDMVRGGTWTWDNFDEMLHEITNVSNGQMIPVIYSHESFMMPAFIGSNNGMMAESTGTGLRFVGSENNNALAAMNFVQTFGARGFVHPYSPLSGHSPYGNIGTAIANGEAFFAFVQYGMVRNLMQQVPGYESEYKFGILPTPLGPNGTKFNTVVTNDLVYHIMYCSWRYREAAAILVAIANRTSQRMYCVVQRERDCLLLSEGSAEMLELMLSNVVVDASRIHTEARRGAGYGIVGAGLSILRGEETPEQAMQRIDAQIQYWFDNLNEIEVWR